jgi:DNA-binding CsgD family transcriptional regulator
MSQATTFSEREQEVISLLLEGKSNKQIAFALGVSTRTVEYHLGKIYALLQVTSRSEAIIRLAGTHLWKPTGTAVDHELRLSTVETADQPPQTEGNHSVSIKRFPLKTFRLLGVGLVVLAVIVFLFLSGANHNQTAPSAVASQQISSVSRLASESPATLPNAILSPREQIVATEKQLAAQYDQAVTAEMQNGTVETSTDPHSGKEVIRFTGNSLDTIAKLYDVFTQQLVDLNKQYLALYLASVQPTPFPTQSNPKAADDYYQQLLDQYPAYIDQLVKDGPTVRVYDLADGTYYDRVIGDAYAKGEIMADAMQTLHDPPPQLTMKEQENFMEQIRKTLGDLNLGLTFQGVQNLANAGGIKAAIFVDEAGNQYSVAIDAGRLAGIDPPLGPHINVPALEVTPIADLRGQAEKFAADSSLRFTGLKDQLQYEESSKGDIYFFRWDYRGKDWAGTSWAMMPPFLQIGMSADGKLVTYINTLDLY